MNVNTIASIVAILGAVIAIYNVVIPKVVDSLRGLGFCRIRPRSDFARKKYVAKLMRGCHYGDKFLVVGRTLRKFVEEEFNNIEEALRRGAHLDFLLLDPASLAAGQEPSETDLRPLQIQEARDLLEKHLAFTIRQLEDLGNRAVNGKYEGSFRVHYTEVVLFHSAVFHKPGREREKKKTTLFYDFSFGDRPDQKFFLRHKVRWKREGADFGNQLHAYYLGFLAKGVSYKALEYDPLKQLLQHYDRPFPQAATFLTEAKELIEAPVDREVIRNNDFKNFIWITDNVFRSVADHSAPRHPLSVQLEITNKCSTRCTHCYRHSWDTDEGQELTGDRWLGLLDELADMKVETVTISGGEPTTRPELKKIVKYASKVGLGVGLLTNGISIDRSLADVLAENADWVRFSLDGSNEEVYGRVRRLPAGQNGAAFGQVMTSIENLKRAQREARSDCKIGICYTIQRNNIEDVEDMVTLARGLGLPGGDKAVTFKFAHGANGFLCNQSQVRNFFRDVLKNDEMRKAANFEYLSRFIADGEHLHDVANGRPTEWVYISQGVRCFTPYLFSLIDARGDVYPCCFLYYDNATNETSEREKRMRHRLGNVAEVNFATVWASKEYQDARERLRLINPTDSEFDPCGQCTRHCNHNVWLTGLFDHYLSAVKSSPQAKQEYGNLVASYPRDKVWL